jgi:hypothetical protein
MLRFLFQSYSKITLEDPKEIPVNLQKLLAGCSLFHLSSRESAIKLSGENSEASKRALLLSDIKAIFEKAQANRIASAEICAKLGDIEEHPWPEWRNGQPITVRQLARSPEPLGIRPKQLRMGEANIRGYELDDFADGFSRYLPCLATTPHPPSTSDVAPNAL